MTRKALSQTEPLMSDEHLKPLVIDRETWMYAEKRGLCVVRQRRNPKGELVHADLFYLPWRKVERAVAIRPVPRKRRS